MAPYRDDENNNDRQLLDELLRQAGAQGELLPKLVAYMGSGRLNSELIKANVARLDTAVKQLENLLISPTDESLMNRVRQLSTDLKSYEAACHSLAASFNQYKEERAEREAEDDRLRGQRHLQIILTVVGFIITTIIAIAAHVFK